MPISQNILEQLSQNLFIRPDLKDEIVTKWDVFTEAQKNSLLEVIEMGHGVQTALITHCAAKNPDFAAGFKQHIANTKSRAIKECEAVDRDADEEQADELIEEIIQM